MLIKTRGIVLRTVKYSETSLIADIYTESKGLQTYIFGGVRKQGASTKAGLLQVMSLLDLVAYHRPGRAMHRVKEIGSAFVYGSLPFKVRRSAVGQFITEVARRTIHEPEENPALFDFLFQQYTWLDTTGHPIGNLHLHYLLGLSGFLGFLPGGEFSEETPFFDMGEGVFSDVDNVHGHVLTREYSGLLYSLLVIPLEEAHTVSLTSAQRKKLLGYFLDYYRLHIDNFPKIHSHLILQEVLG